MYELALLSGNGYTQGLTDYEKTELAAATFCAISLVFKSSPAAALAAMAFCSSSGSLAASYAFDMPILPFLNSSLISGVALLLIFG